MVSCTKKIHWTKISIAYLSKNKGRNPILDTFFKSQTWNKCTDIMHTQKYRDKIHMLIDKIFHFNPQWNLIFLALIFQTLIDKISFTSIRTVSSRRLSPHLLPFHHWCNRRDQFKPWMRFLPSKSHVTRCVLNSPIDMNRQKIH